MSARFYIWDDNKGFKRYSMKGFNASYRGLPNKDLIESAEQSLKFVVVFLNMKNRKPVEVIRIDTFKYTVDKDGKFNQDEVMETMRFVVEFVSSRMKNFNDHRKSNVIWSSGIFAERKYKALYSWELNESQLNQLIGSIFKVAY